jgi:isoleucyl-tRNA synthetase
LSVIEGGGNQKEKPAYGADTLRLWVSGVDYSGDVCVGDGIMKQVKFFLCMYIYIYICVYVRVCVCDCKYIHKDI